MIIKDPDVAKLFADDTRRHILHILRRHEHSTTELAKELGKSHSSIIHHLKLLREAGLVEETRTEKVRNMVVSYYRSTARRLPVGPPARSMRSSRRVPNGTSYKPGTATCPDTEKRR